MSTENSDLQWRLEGLVSDLGDTGLPGAAAARTRGTQRGRRQAAGAVAGVMLVLTGGTFAVAQLSGPDDFQPAGPPSETIVEPAPTPTDAAMTEIPEAALMTADDIVDVRGFDWTTSDENRPNCFPAIGIDELVHRAQATYESGSTPLVDYASHDVYLIEPGASADVADLLVGEASDCPTAASQSVGRLGNVGDEGHFVTYTYGDDGGLQWLVEFSVVRRGDVLSTVTRWYAEHTQAPDFETPKNAAERMCNAVFGASCVTGDPTYEPQESGDEPDASAGPHTIAEEPFLNEDQVNPVGTRQRFVQRQLSAGFDHPTWDVLCFDDLETLEPIQVMVSQPWTDEYDASLYQTVLEFTDADAADQWLRGYTAIEDRCVTFDIEDNYGSVTDYGLLDLPSGDDALAWSVFYAPPEAGTAFWGAAAARRDNVVFLLTYGAMDGPYGPGGPDSWVEYVTPRLSPALDNAIGSPS